MLDDDAGDLRITDVTQELIADFMKPRSRSSEPRCGEGSANLPPNFSRGPGRKQLAGHSQIDRARVAFWRVRRSGW